MRRLPLTRPIVVAVLVMACAGLGAAGPASAAEGQGSASAAHALPPRVKTQLHRSPGKPTAPIAIGYAFSARPALGSPFDVRITASAEGITDLDLTVRGDEGLEVGVPVLTSSSTDGAERAWTVTATASKEGALYLSVLVQGRSGADQPARDLLIPIQIGAKAPAKAAATEAKTDASGERIIVLPADTKP
jgi:hypothetical protein